MRVLPLLSCTVLLALVSACGSNETTSSGSGGGGAGGTGSGGTTSGGGESAPLTVDTDKGSVEGKLIGSTRAFLGIPFAAPPTGDLRWKPPAPHEAWKGTLDATKKGR